MKEHLRQIRTTTFALLLSMLAIAALPAPAFTYAQPADEPVEEIEPVMDWGVKQPRPEPQTKTTTNRGTVNFNDPAPRKAAEEPTVSFGAFSEPIELATLIDFVGAALNINIVVKGAPTGEVSFNAPVSVPKSQLIDLLDVMLEQYSFTISHEPVSNFWIVQPIADVRPTMGSDRASTQIISTPNIKPSLIKPALDAAIGGSNAANKTSNSILPLDELGVLIINAPPRDIARIRLLVDELLRIDEDQRYIRFELSHIAAPVALERASGLVGGNSSGNQRLTQNQNNPQGGIGLSAASLSNMADRITVDPQGNALIFKGTDAEIARVQEVLDVIDVPNTLEPKSYFAGSSAAQIADIARNRGLGEVISISEDSQNPFAQGNIRINNQNGGLSGQQSSSTTGGPVMVVDTSRGNIIYYGTAAQQKQLADLMLELGTEDERVVIKDYVLAHSDAEVVAELMTAIITGQQQTGDSDFLPGSSSNNNRNNQVQFARIVGQSGGSDVTAAFDPDIVAVIADPDNNQVIVRAPIKQQDDLEKLIGRLDRRRPQVFLQAMIVSVSNTENFTLAFESQINAGQFGVTTGNALQSATTGGAFGDTRNVSTGLAGLTSAVIMTNQIPIIINASQTDTDVRILSTPQLLVNDNQESEIVTLSEQPYQEISQSDGGNISSFGGFAEAGTTLRVTPSISDGGFLRLDYFVELSNFTATSGTDGSPPPRDRNTVQGTATIPSDATIVIGGITVDNVRDTVIKVPLLGDIPLVGELFKNTSKINTQSKLYIFLTPRIMTDPNFVDLKLMSEGPYAEMDLDPRVPDLEPVMINASPSRSMPDRDSLSDDQFRMNLPRLPAGPTDRDQVSPSLSPVLIDPSEGTD